MRYLLDRVRLEALHDYLRVPCQRGFGLLIVIGC